MPIRNDDGFMKIIKMFINQVCVTFKTDIVWILIRY